MLHVCILSHSVMSDSVWPYGLLPNRLFYPWDSPDKNTRMGCHALLQGIFLAQESNLSLLCFRYRQVGSLPLAPPWKHPCYSGPNCNFLTLLSLISLWKFFNNSFQCSAHKSYFSRDKTGAFCISSIDRLIFLPWATLVTSH